MKPETKIWQICYKSFGKISTVYKIKNVIKFWLKHLPIIWKILYDKPDCIIYVYYIEEMVYTPT